MEQVEGAAPTEPRAPWSTDQKVGVGAAALAALGLVLPWGRVLFVSISGIETDDGQLFAVALLAASAVAWALTFRGVRHRRALFALAVLAIGMSALAAYDLMRLQATDLAAPGVGIFLSLAGAIGFALLVRRRLAEPRLKTVLVGLVAGSMVLGGVAGAAGAEDAGLDFGGDASTEDAVEGSAGERVEVDGAEIVLERHFRGSGRDLFGDATADEVLLVEVTVRNTGEDDESFDSTDWSIETPDAVIESATWDDRPDALDETLAPGGEATGVISFPLSGDGVYTLRYVPLFEPLATWRLRMGDRG